MYTMDDCLNIWKDYIECVDRYHDESKFCKPILVEYNKCVFRNEHLYNVQKSNIIENKNKLTYWNDENSFIWWSL